MGARERIGAAGAAAIGCAVLFSMSNRLGLAPVAAVGAVTGAWLNAAGWVGGGETGAVWNASNSSNESNGISVVI